MKRITIILCSMFLFVACSSDDDNGDEVVLTNKEKLVLGSPWNISNVTVLQVYGEHTTPLNELNTQTNAAYLESEMRLTFNTNNTGSIFTTTTGSLPYQYNIIGTDSGQNGFSMNIGDIVTAVNCSVTQTKFIFEQNIWIADGDNGDVEAQAKFTFDKGN